MGPPTMRGGHVIGAVFMVTVVQILVWNSLSKAGNRAKAGGALPTVGSELMDKFRRYPGKFETHELSHGAHLDGLDVGPHLSQNEELQVHDQGGRVSSVSERTEHRAELDSQVIVPPSPREPVADENLHELGRSREGGAENNFALQNKTAVVVGNGIDATFDARNVSSRPFTDGRNEGFSRIGREGGGNDAASDIHQNLEVEVSRAELLHPPGAAAAVAAADGVRRVVQKAGAVLAAAPPETTITAAGPSTPSPMAGLDLVGRCEAIEPKRESGDWERYGCECVLQVDKAKAVDCYLARAHILHEAGAVRAKALAGGAGLRGLNHTRKILAFGSRVPGEVGWNKTITYIQDFFENLDGWRLESDCFSAMTPLGPKPMCNLIASARGEAGPCLLDLAAHLESKFFAHMHFEAATDSAAPVGMLLELAEALSPAFAAADGACPCMRLILFDGEEAFERWSETDSLYGARHLADLWSASADPTRPARRRIDSMRVLVLLDLLGYRHPQLTWHFENTRLLFARLEQVESRLRTAGLLDGDNSKPYLSSNEQLPRGGISDDHIPFLRRGVPILHLIPKPFPKFWHTSGDNTAVLHPPSIADLSLVLRVTVAELYRLNL